MSTDFYSIEMEYWGTQEGIGNDNEVYILSALEESKTSGKEINGGKHDHVKNI